MPRWPSPHVKVFAAREAGRVKRRHAMGLEVAKASSTLQYRLFRRCKPAVLPISLTLPTDKDLNAGIDMAAPDFTGSTVQLQMSCAAVSPAHSSREISINLIPGRRRMRRSTERRSSPSAYSIERDVEWPNRPISQTRQTAVARYLTRDARKRTSSCGSSPCLRAGIRRHRLAQNGEKWPCFQAVL